MTRASCLRQGATWLTLVISAKSWRGVGAYFLDSLYADIDSLIVNAGIHPLFSAAITACCAIIPFAVYHRAKGLTATPYAVLDCRRGPAWTRSCIGCA